MCDLVWYCHSVRWTTTIMREMKKKYIHTHASLIQKESNVHTLYEFDFVIWNPIQLFYFSHCWSSSSLFSVLIVEPNGKKIAQNEMQNKTTTVAFNVILGKAEVKWKDRTKKDNNCISKEEACHFQFFKFSFPFLGYCCSLYLITMNGLLICIVPFFAFVLLLLFFSWRKKRHRFFSINFPMFWNKKDIKMTYTRHGKWKNNINNS